MPLAMLRALQWLLAWTESGILAGFSVCITRECFEPWTLAPQIWDWFWKADKAKQYETHVSKLKLQAEKDFAEVMHSKELHLGHLERTLKETVKQQNQPLVLQVQVGDRGQLVAIEPCSD